jgi:hypothetical protein
MAITNGIVAEMDINTQLSVASRKPSRGFSSRRCARVANEISRPPPELMAAAMMKANDWPSPVISEQMNGSANVPPKIASNEPRTLATPSMRPR